MISLALKDRGIVKWKAASFLPEQVSSLHDLVKDYYSTEKPILDEYQVVEFENKINYAMEYLLPVRFIAWEDGYEWVYSGNIKRLDPLSKTIDVELNNQEKYTMKIKFDDIVRVDVLS